MPEKVIQFEGQEHHFPDDFTDAEIAKALKTAHPQGNPGAQRTPDTPMAEQAKAAGPGEGFFGTLGRDAKFMPTEMMEAGSKGPVEFLRNIQKSREEVGERGKQEGGLTGLAMRGASYIPFLGPQAASIIEDMFGSQGDPGRGAAHAVEAAVPFLGAAKPGAPFAMARGGLRGAAEDAMTPVPLAKRWLGVSVPAPLVTGYAGAELGGRLGHPEMGAALGAGLPLVRGLFRGAREGLEDYRASQVPGEPTFQPKALLGNGKFNMPGAPDESGPIPQPAPRQTPLLEGGGKFPAPLVGKTQPFVRPMPPAPDTSGPIPFTPPESWSHVPQSEVPIKPPQSFDEMLGNARARYGLPRETAPLGPGLRERWDEGAPSETVQSSRPGVKFLKAPEGGMPGQSEAEALRDILKRKAK